MWFIQNKQGNVTAPVRLQYSDITLALHIENDYSSLFDTFSLLCEQFILLLL